MRQNLRVQAKADPARHWMKSIWLAVVVGCVYTLSAQMSLALLTPDGVAVFWPAAGVAAGTLIAGGPNARWGVAGGTMGGRCRPVFAAAAGLIVALAIVVTITIGTG